MKAGIRREIGMIVATVTDDTGRQVASCHHFHRSEPAARKCADRLRKRAMVTAARMERVRAGEPKHDPSQVERCVHPRTKLEALGGGRYRCRTCDTVIQPTHPDRL